MSDSDDETKPDMTRIEDLSEYLHEEDPETDAQFDIPPTPDQEEEEESFETMSVDDLEEAPPVFEETDEETDEAPAFEVEEDNDAFSGDEGDAFASDNDFGSDSTEPDFETPAEFDSSESDNDDLEPIEEVREIEEESSLLEEVENEIQDAMSEPEDDSEELSFDQGEDEDNSFSFDEESEEEIEKVEEPQADFQEEPQEELQEEPQEEVQEESPVFTSIPEPEPTPIVTPPKAARENFSDVNEFGNSISYGQVTAGGNPPFSLILRKIRYLEDSERIIEILRDHGLCDESNEADYQQGLNNGSMLISQLNEYSAIYLAHKFRRFDLEILVGLADEIHPSKNYDMDYKGLVRKENLRQNKSESFSLEDQIVEVEAILLATTPTLENYRIDNYLGVVSTHIMIEESEFQKLQETDTLNSDIDADELLKEIDDELSEEKSHTAVAEIGLEEVYQNLAEALKVKAFKLKGNAVVGINYQITPLINQKSGEQTPSIRYKISCTGNAVWVGGKEAPRSEA